MPDVVVTVPKTFGLTEWIAEGDAAGEPWSGYYWSFYVASGMPSVCLTGVEWAVEWDADAFGRVPCKTTGDELVRSHRPPPMDGGAWLLAAPDQRCYVVYGGCLRGYSPLFAIETWEGSLRMRAFIRRGDAVAVTIPLEVRGFRGYRYRWWDRSIEVPFPGWQNPDAKPWEAPRV